jgi:hypothetical protein
MERKELDRIDVDRQDFLSFYQSNIDLNAIGGPRQLRTIQDFLSDQVRGFFCSVPRDNVSVTETLKRAVREGAVIPYIERNWTGAPRVRDQIYAPQSWPKTANGGTGFVHSAEPFAAARRAAEEVLERRSRVDLTEFGSSARRASEISGFDWRRAPKTVPSDDSSPMQNFTDSTPLSDAEPFQYADDLPFSDAIEIAARGVSETDEGECFATYESDLDLCKFARAMTQDNRALALCQARAFANYQTCRGY